jgi:hypothetical protein
VLFREDAPDEGFGLGAGRLPAEAVRRDLARGALSMPVETRAQLTARYLEVVKAAPVGTGSLAPED